MSHCLAKNISRTCSIVQKVCTGEHQQFSDLQDCLSFYGSLSLRDPACEFGPTAYSLQGNTVGCRYLHSLLAERYPEDHCMHVGKNGSYCVSADCSARPEPLSNATHAIAAEPCSAEEKAELERRLVLVMPECLAELGGGSCASNSSCAAALHQVGLLDLDGAARRRATRVAAKATTSCRRAIRSKPLSSTLYTLGLDPTVLLPICGSGDVVTDECVLGEYLDHSSQRCSSISRFTSAQTREAILRRVGGLVQSGQDTINATLRRSISSVDNDYVYQSQIAVSGGRLAQLTTETSQKASPSAYIEQLEAAFGSQAPCPFSHGVVVSRHADVVKILSDHRQRRSASRLFDVVDISTDLESSAPSTLMPWFHSTSSELHEKYRNLLYALMPSMHIPISDDIAGFEILDQTKIPTPTEFLSWVVRNYFHGLFPQNQGMSSQMVQTVLLFMSRFSAVYVRSSSSPFPCLLFLFSHTASLQQGHNVEWHEYTRYLAWDSARALAKPLTTWLETYFGETRLNSTANTFNVTKPAILSLLRTVIGVTLTGPVQLLRSFYNRSSGPHTNLTTRCFHARQFERDPHAYVLESLRLDSKPTGHTLLQSPRVVSTEKGSFVIPVNDSSGFTHSLVYRTYGAKCVFVLFLACIIV